MSDSPAKKKQQRGRQPGQKVKKKQGQATARKTRSANAPEVATAEADRGDKFQSPPSPAGPGSRKSSAPVTKPGKHNSIPPTCPNPPPTCAPNLAPIWPQSGPEVTAMPVSGQPAPRAGSQGKPIVTDDLPDDIATQCSPPTGTHLHLLVSQPWTALMLLCMGAHVTHCTL